jgi:ketosteroid isomerase-like protein
MPVEFMTAPRAFGEIIAMSENKKLIETYLATKDKSKLGPLLADDVEWVEWGDGVPPSGVITRGKEAFIKNYGDNELRSEIHRLTEENDVVVAEGTAHVTKKDGGRLSVEYVNIFEIERGKIKKKSSFGALIKDTA